MDATIRIVRVQLDELDPGPLPVAFQDSTMGPFVHWKLGWLRLTADDGTVGQAPGALNEETMAALLGSGALSVEQWWHKIWWMLRNQGHRNPATSGALCAIDMAMRDILAQRAGQPWHRFMGATRDVVPVYGSGGGTNRSVEELVAEMRDMVSCGFKTVKMKVGMNFGTRMDEDVVRVRAVRQAIGSGIGLAIDANQVWSAEQALGFARRVADQEIAWFEEPVRSADRAALRQLCRECPMPVAMGESENHWLGFRDLIECGVAHPQPSPHALPGYGRWVEAVEMCEGRGLVWSAGGFSHLTAMCVATRPGGLVEYLRSIIGHLATLYASKPEIADGEIRLPMAAGLPVKIDWEVLQKRGAVRLVVDRKA